MFINDETVKIENVILNWDGINKPETRDDGSKSFNVRFCAHPNAQEINELEQIAQKALQSGKFQGNLPNGANWPLGTWADSDKLGPIVNGMMSIGAGSGRMPPVYKGGQKLDLMQFGGMLYPGCKISVLVHAFTYDNKQKGIAFGLDGFEIIDANAPRLNVGGGMNESDVSNAFGANNQGGNQGNNNGGQNYSQNNNNQGNQNNGGQNNNNQGNNNGQNQNNGGGNNNQGNNNQGNNNNGAPVQSPDYMQNQNNGGNNNQGNNNGQNNNNQNNNGQNNNNY